MPRGAITKNPIMPIEDRPAAEELARTYGVEGHTYESYREAFPRTEGPPPVSEGKYKKAFSPKEPSVTVSMDGGAFRAIWELVEAEATRKWETRNSMASSAAYVRAVQALREAWRQHAAAGSAQPKTGGAGSAPGSSRSPSPGS